MSLLEKKHPEIFAYKAVRKDFTTPAQNLSKSLRHLIDIARRIEGPFMRELKPYIVLTLKWRFDFLAKTQESPFLIQDDVDYWIQFLEACTDLSRHHWFSQRESPHPADPWKRTRKAFNYMWPRNTEKDQYELSCKMVELRVEQIVSLIPNGSSWLRNNRSILDVGCGPGRYISALLKYKPRKVVGIDRGVDIIAKNKKRFSSHPHVQFRTGHLGKIPFRDKSFDFVVSAGVLHHAPDSIEKTIHEHARVVTNNGYFFIFIAGKGGLELTLWAFLRDFLYDIPVEDMFHRFNGKIHPLRLQGLLDHGYGEYQQTSREDCERWLMNNFSSIQRVSGIQGLDITPELYPHDIYFTERFGTGHLRYLCKK